MKKADTKPAEKSMDGIAWRRAILAGLSSATKPVLPLSSGKLAESLPFRCVETSFLQLCTATSPITAFETPAHEFDDLLEPYASLFQAPAQPRVELPSVDLLVQEKQEAHHVKTMDEWEGLF